MKAKVKPNAKAATPPKGHERRKQKRWKVAVLVRCSIPKLSDDLVEMEMWAKDVSSEGLQLEWVQGLAIQQVGKKEIKRPVRFGDVNFSPGSRIQIQDLFYDDEGDSPFIEGEVSWARPGMGRDGERSRWSLGISFTDPNKQKSLTGAFKDFLTIIRHPKLAIDRASRKKN